MIGPKVQKPTPAERRAAHKAVSARSGGMCEGCGVHPKTDRHHRQHGAHGRIDSVDNMIDLGDPSGMPGGNVSGCHGIAHSGEGYLLGWSVRLDNDPALIPIYHKHRDVFTLRGEPIPHAVAVQAFVDAGVVPDVATYLAWFEAGRPVWALEVAR